MDIPQTSINTGLPPKVREADGNVSPFATFNPESLIHAGNRIKSGVLGFLWVLQIGAKSCSLVLNFCYDQIILLRHKPE